MLGIEQWISCIASCVLYHYTTSMHSMVISRIKSRYIPIETYTSVARYLLAGVRHLARVQPRPLLHTSTNTVHTQYILVCTQYILSTYSVQGYVESSRWLQNTPCQLSPGWDWLSPQPLLRCPEWLWICQARLWRGTAAVHRYPGPWFIWLQLRTWVNSWASSQHWRQASGPSARASWAEAKLEPNLKQNLEIFQGWSSCPLWLTNLNHHDWRLCVFLVLLLFYLFNYNKASS